jgi:hypothetical protein
MKEVHCPASKPGGRQGHLRPPQRVLSAAAVAPANRAEVDAVTAECAQLVRQLRGDHVTEVDRTRSRQAARAWTDHRAHRTF